MPVERVSITPSQFLLRATDGNIKFNSNTQFIKTDPTGTLYAGGYARAPCIYGFGVSNIFDHQDGGEYVSDFTDSKLGSLVYTPTFIYSVPKATNITYREVYDGSEFSAYKFRSSYRNIQFYNYETYTSANISISFFWTISRFYYSSSDTYTWLMYPTLTSNTLPAVTNNNGGGFIFPYYSNEATNWVDSDYNIKIAGIVDTNNLYTKRAGVFSSSPPLAFSLAVTP